MGYYLTQLRKRSQYMTIGCIHSNWLSLRLESLNGITFPDVNQRTKNMLILIRLTMSWSRSVWLFCLDITYGQSRRDTYSIMSLSDWTMCQTYVYMAWTWHVALSNIKASCKLTTISHPVIDSSDIVLSLLLSLQRVHCFHVWVWVMHVGSVDVRVMILQYRRWSLYTTCPSYTHAYTMSYQSYRNSHMFLRSNVYVPTQ